MEIPKEAHLETKVVLTWGSTDVMLAGEHALVLRRDVPRWHPRYNATVCQ